MSVSHHSTEKIEALNKLKNIKNTAEKVYNRFCVGLITENNAKAIYRSISLVEYNQAGFISIETKVIDELIDELKNIPSSDVLRKTKYRLVEELINELSKINQDIINIYNENLLDLNEISVASIDDIPGVWFAYPMALKAKKNMRLLMNFIDQKINQSLQNLPSSNDYCCCFCLESLETIISNKDLESIHTTPCNHKFCKDCWNTFLSSPSTLYPVKCPICRTIVETNTSLQYSNAVDLNNNYDENDEAIYRDLRSDMYDENYENDESAYRDLRINVTQN